MQDVRGGAIKAAKRGTFFCLRRRRAAGCCEYEKVLAETCCNLTHARDHIERCGLWTLFCHCGLCVCVWGRVCPRLLKCACCFATCCVMHEHYLKNLQLRVVVAFLFKAAALIPIFACTAPALPIIAMVSMVSSSWRLAQTKSTSVASMTLNLVLVFYVLLAQRRNRRADVFLNALEEALKISGDFLVLDCSAR